MDGCAAGAEVLSRGVWSVNEEAYLSEAEKKAANVQKKLDGFLKAILHSPFMVAKYPSLAKLQIRQVGPFSGEIKKLIEVANTKVSELRLILQYLISSEETKANLIRLKGMLQEGGKKPNCQAAFVRYALYGALHEFVKSNVEALRAPQANQAVLGLFIEKPLEEPIHACDIEAQLGKLKDLQKALEGFLISQDLLLSAKICRAHDLFLSHLDMLAPAAIVSSFGSLHASQGDGSKRIAEKKTKAIEASQKLGGDIKILFSPDQPEEKRLEAARNFINSGLTLSVSVEVRLKAWRTLAENDPIYRGLFKPWALAMADKINEFNSDAIITDIQKREEIAAKLLREVL